jgi:hypothetical protein
MVEQDADAKRIALDYAGPLPPRPAEPVRGRVLNRWGWGTIHAGYSLVILTIAGVVCADRWVIDLEFDTIEVLIGLGVVGGFVVCAIGVGLAALAAARPD